MKKFTLFLLVFITSLQAYDCDKNKIIELLNINNSKAKLYKIEKNEYLDGFCTAYVVFDKNIDINYVNIEKKLVLAKPNLFLVKDKDIQFITGNEQTKFLNDYMKDIEEDSKNKSLALLNKKESYKALFDTKDIITYGTPLKNNRYEFLVFYQPKCPFCQKFNEFVKKENVKLYYNYYPINKETYQLLTNKDKNQKVKNYPFVGKERMDILVNVRKDINYGGTPLILVYDNKNNKIKDIISTVTKDSLNLLKGYIYEKI